MRDSGNVFIALKGLYFLLFSEITHLYQPASSIILSTFPISIIFKTKANNDDSIGVRDLPSHTGIYDQLEVTASPSYPLP
jgi:hypothetical protein